MPQRMFCNAVLDGLVAACPELAAHLDLYVHEDAGVVMNQVGYLLRDGALSDYATAFVFRYVNGLAERNEPLVENVLEVLASSAKSVARAEAELSGRAHSMFEKLLIGWQTRRG